MTVSRRGVLGGLAASPFAGLRATAEPEPGVPPPDAEHRVRVKGGNLYVRVNGDLKAGPAPLMLVHGGPGGALWQFFAALPLAQTRAIVLYDQRDSGRSDAPGDVANWTVDRYVSEIAAVRSALGLERFHLLGHSWGGILAARYAAAAPPGLRSLILQGAPASARGFKASIDSLLTALPEPAGETIRAHARTGAGDDAAYAQAMGVFMKKHLSRTSVKDVALPYMRSTPEDRGDALAAAMTGTDLTQGLSGVLEDFDDEPLLRRIQAPALLMCGEFDIMTPEATRALLPKLKDGALDVVAGGGHMIQFDQPAAWRTPDREIYPGPRRLTASLREPTLEPLTRH